MSVLVPILRCMEKITDSEQYPWLVYGTLRQGYSNHDRIMGGRATLRETIKIPGYRMTISPNGGGGYPYIVAGIDSIVVEVWDALQGQHAYLMNSLDSLEGFHPTAPGVNHYDRTLIEYIDSAGYMQRGWIYIASAWTREEIIMDNSEIVPSGDWADVVSARLA